MDLPSLIALYPVAERLVKISPKLKEWIEKKAKKDDPYLFLQMEMFQSRLEMPILTAMLSNPDVTEDQIEERLIKSVKVARNVSKIVKEL